MSGLETTLIIILAVGFAVLLLLSIVVVFVIIRILQNIHHITQKAESATDNLAQATLQIAKKLAPVAVSTLVSTMLKKFKKRRRADEEEAV